MTDSGGTSVPNGSLSVKFVFYDASSGGNCLYSVRGTCGTPAAKTVTVTNGVFSTQLGDTNGGDNEIPDALFDNNAVFLGVTIGSDSEMTPRKRITAAPYAMNADRLDHLDSTSSGSTTPYIVATTSNGNLTVTGDPQGAGVANGVVSINPAAATGGETLFGIADNGAARFQIAKEGTTTLIGSLLATSSSSTAQFVFRGAAGQTNDAFEIQNVGTDRLFSVSATATSIGAGSRLIVGSTNTLIINSSGNFEAINGVTARFPASQGANGQMLTNDGAGNLTWTTALGTQTMLQTFNNSTSSNEIFVNNAQGGLTIADQVTGGFGKGKGIGNLFEVQDRVNAAGDYSTRFFTVSSTATISNQAIFVPETGSTPMYSFVNDADTGINSQTDGEIDFSSNGSTVLIMANTGDITMFGGGKFTVNGGTIDIGASTGDFADTPTNLNIGNAATAITIGANSGAGRTTVQNNEFAVGLGGEFTVSTTSTLINSAAFGPYAIGINTSEPAAALTLADTSISPSQNIFEIQNTSGGGGYTQRYFTVSSTGTHFEYSSVGENNPQSAVINNAPIMPSNGGFMTPIALTTSLSPSGALASGNQLFPYGMNSFVDLSGITNPGSGITAVGASSLVGGGMSIDTSANADYSLTGARDEVNASLDATNLGVGTFTTTVGDFENNANVSAGSGGILSSTAYGILVQNGANLSLSSSSFGYGAYINNGAQATTNYGLVVGVSGGSVNNYAAIFNGGPVGIGLNDPAAQLTIADGNASPTANIFELQNTSGGGGYTQRYLTVSSTSTIMRGMNTIATLGSELVTNGGFDVDASWTEGTGWTISGSQASHAAGNATALSQVISVTAGEIYDVTFTVNTTTAGSLTPSLGGASISAIGATTGIKNYEVVLNPTSGNTLSLTANSAWAGTIDSVSVTHITKADPVLLLDNSASTAQVAFRATQFNVLIGTDAGRALTYGNEDVAVGRAALAANTGGAVNVAIGSLAMTNSTLSTSNVAIGAEAMRTNTTGSTNVAVGESALYSNTIGSGNTALNSLDTNTEGSNNTFLGYSSRGSTGLLNRSTAIGYNAVVGQDNAMVLGGTGTDLPNVGIGDTTPDSLLTLRGPLAPTQTLFEISNSANSARYFTVSSTSTLINPINSALTYKVGINNLAPANTFTVGSTSTFEVDTNGNLVKIRNVAYSWPSSQGGATTVLQNNGSGTLSWVAASGTVNLLQAFNNSTSSNELYVNNTQGALTIGDQVTGGAGKGVGLGNLFEIQDRINATGDYGARFFTVSSTSTQVLGGSRLIVGSTNTLIINSSGNFESINGVTALFPSSQGASNSFLRNDGAGNLTWSVIASNNSLMQDYNNATSSLELPLNSTSGAITIADQVTGGAGKGVGLGNLFEVQSRVNATGDYDARYFTVSSTSVNATYNSDTTQTSQALTVNGLTTGVGFAINSSATAMQGMLANVTLSGNNANNFGPLLSLNSTGASSIAPALAVNEASTGDFAQGGVRLNFSGAHTGYGLELDDVTTNGTAMVVNANSITSGTGSALVVKTNGITSGTGNGLLVSSTSAYTGANGLLEVSSANTGVTGPLLLATSNSTGAFTNGGVRFNFTGAHTGSAFQIDDVTAAGTLFSLNGGQFSTGTLISATGTIASTGNANGYGLVTLNTNILNTGSFTNLKGSALLINMNDINVGNAGQSIGADIEITENSFITSVAHSHYAYMANINANSGSPGDNTFTALYYASNSDTSNGNQIVVDAGFKADVPSGGTGAMTSGFLATTNVNTGMTNGFLVKPTGTVTNGFAIGTGGTVTNGINFTGTGAVVTTDFIMQNGESIDNNTDGTINTSATTLQVSPVTNTSDALVVAGSTYTSGNLLKLTGGQMNGGALISATGTMTNNVNATAAGLITLQENGIYPGQFTNTDFASGMLLNMNDVSTGTCGSYACGGSMIGYDLEVTMNSFSQHDKYGYRARVLPNSGSPTDNVFQALYYADNADTATGNQLTVTDGFRASVSGGVTGMTNGFDVNPSSGTITNGYAIGSAGTVTNGISFSGAATVITNDFVMQNGETIQNDTDGNIKFTDGTNTLCTVVDNGTTGGFSCTGAPGVDTLQQTYLSATSTTELSVTSPASLGAFTIADQVTGGAGKGVGIGNLFEIQSRVNTAGDYDARYFTVSSTSTLINAGANVATASNYKFSFGNAAPANYFVVGTATSTFEIDVAGNIRKINNVAYSWPSSQGGASSVLQNNGSGTLTWVAASSTVNLLQAFNNSTSSNELFVNNTQGALTISDQVTGGAGKGVGLGNLFEVQDRINTAGDYGTRFFTVSSTATLMNPSNSSGYNIGIGNSSPSALLSVGSSSQLQVNTSGNLTTSGSITSTYTIGNSLVIDGTALVVDGVSNRVGIGTASGMVAPLDFGTTTGNDEIALYETSSSYIYGMGVTGGRFNFNLAHADGTTAYSWWDDTAHDNERMRLYDSGALDVTTLNTSTNGLCHAGSGTGFDEVEDCSGTPSDLAEWYPADGSATATDIVVATDATFGYQEQLFNPRTGVPSGATGTYEVSVLGRSSTPYDPRIIGIASTSPHQTFGEVVRDKAAHPLPIGIAGRVPARVNVQNGAIKAGDAITTSSAVGAGMRATKPGMIVGYALAAWNGPGEGVIQVLVHPGWYAGMTIGTDGTLSILSDDFAFAPTSIATADAQALSSHALDFRGSAWNSASNTSITRDISIRNDVTDKDTYQLTFANSLDQTVASLSQSGDLAIAGSLTVNGGFDYAETFPSTPDLDQGDLVMVDPDNTTGYGVKKSAGTYENTLIGVVSTKPGFLTGKTKDGFDPIALAGRVPAKVSTENGEIKAGDPITSSSTPGVGMKATEAGRVIGIALQGYAGTGTGTIMLFINPSWWNGPTPAAATTASSGISITQDSLLDLKNSTLSNVAAIVSTGGNWSITSDGELIAKKIEAQTVQANDIVVVQTETDASAAEGTVPAGYDAVVVQNPHMTSKAKVFVSFLGDPGGSYWIGEKGEGNFTLHLAQPAITTLPFEYWILGVDDRRPGPPIGAATSTPPSDGLSPPSTDSGSTGSASETAVTGSSGSAAASSDGTSVSAPG